MVTEDYVEGGRVLARRGDLVQGVKWDNDSMPGFYILYTQADVEPRQWYTCRYPNPNVGFKIIDAGDSTSAFAAPMPNTATTRTAFNRERWSNIVGLQRSSRVVYHSC